jgi:predicted GNAT family N-acyltransferase
MEFEISTTDLPSVVEVQALFSQTSWASERKNHEVGKLLNSMTEFVTIRKNTKLIGFGRAISDGVYRAPLEDIVVDELYRKQGLGGLIIENLLTQLTEIEEVYLNTGADLEGFYTKYGFRRSDAFYMKKDQSAG